MLQELLIFFSSARGVDVFWSPLLVAILAGLILAIVLKSNNSKEKNSKGLTLSEVKVLVQSELDKRPRSKPQPAMARTTRASQTTDDSFVWVVVMGLVFLSVGYAKFQNQVLDYSVIAATSIFGFWAATVIFSLLKGTISGKGWTTYIIVVCILSLLALPILYLSLEPIYSPDGITNLQQVAAESGVVGLIKSYGAEGIIFLTFQVMGFFVLYGSWLFILLSLVYMASSTLVVAGFNGRVVWLWLSLKTTKFAQPIKGTIIVSILYLLSFVLISGLAYEWWRPVGNV
ncbi:TPA: hypothetical protein ACX3GK_004464 [Vibrio parahaemolyticus]|uniref:hypothetical protein n=4 Tax=Vibrio parahaemolyticus TaxID=670 RepID=UPI000411E7E1|nr:hypothetical protein [Vibrio parahaemolyticus]EGR1752209.1 hypothetical protein [Vibrio parahaemolyticus]EHH1242058.1 hypothetical protein [Vibrio parahaemolyticus]EKA7384306.1 hypothetical protein [Vibrio parahaemolyticus]EME0904185.1 hypothetical protein [Vibrio parahaemolyticus]MBE5164925.1 hypothetical protein [Vibrio parahaemolyticus]